MIHDWQQDDESIVHYYQSLLAENGNSYKSVDWGSQASQNLRFDVLLNALGPSAKSLLDVGCGVGDLLSHMQARKLDYQYCGVDITPQMVVACQQRFPDQTFHVANLLDADRRQRIGTFDAVIASGLFNLRKEAPFEYMQTMLKALWEMTGQVLAFNSISGFGVDDDDSTDFAANPLEVMGFCRNELTSRFVLRHDYHRHDFSVYLYKGND